MISTTRTTRRTMSEALDWTNDEAVDIDDEPIDTEDSLDGDESMDSSTDDSTHDRISFVVRMHGKLLPLARLNAAMAEAYIRELKLEQRELLQRLNEVENEMHKLGLDPEKTNPTPKTKNPKEETMRIKHTVQGPVPATPRTPVKATPKTPVKTRIATPARTPAKVTAKVTAKATARTIPPLKSSAKDGWHTLNQDEIEDNIEVIGELLFIDADSPSGYGRRDGKPFATKAGSTYRTLLKDVHGFVKSNSLDAHLKANRADRSLFKATAKATKRRTSRD